MTLNKSVLVNVCVTFVEGFAAAWLTTGNALTKHALVGAGAAGISLVWNTAIKPYLRERKVL